MISLAKPADAANGYVIQKDGSYWNGAEFDDLQCAYIYTSYRGARIAKSQGRAKSGSVIFAVVVRSTPSRIAGSRGH